MIVISEERNFSWLNVVEMPYFSVSDTPYIANDTLKFAKVHFHSN